MKKLILLGVLISAMSSPAQLVFSNQTITVLPEQLSIESVQYSPKQVLTNTVFQWVEGVEVVTNRYFGLRDDEVVTNAVLKQVGTATVTTNAGVWTCHVIFELPKGHLWSLSGFPVTVERFKTRLEIPVDPAVVTAAFGPSAAAGLEFAAGNGAFTPTGQTRDAFLSFAATVLSGGGR